MGLLGDGLDQGGVRVADGDSRNAGDPVLVAVALVVEQVLHPALDHEQGLGVEMEIEFGHVVLPVLDDLLVGDALVGLGLVVEGWQGGREGLAVGFSDHAANVL